MRQGRYQQTPYSHQTLFEKLKEGTVGEIGEIHLHRQYPPLAFQINVCWLGRSLLMSRPWFISLSFPPSYMNKLESTRTMLSELGYMDRVNISLLSTLAIQTDR